MIYLRYKSCGVTREDIVDGTQRDLVQGILPRLPTIIDAAGRGDINTESLGELLELIIGGDYSLYRIFNLCLLHACTCMFIFSNKRHKL